MYRSFVPNSIFIKVGLDPGPQVGVVSMTEEQLACKRALAEPAALLPGEGLLEI